MSIERQIDKTVKNVRDGLDEAAHRTAAEGERTKRDLAGNEMTPGEKAKSVVNEAGHDVKANIDKTKRTVRDNT